MFVKRYLCLIPLTLPLETYILTKGRLGRTSGRSKDITRRDSYGYCLGCSPSTTPHDTICASLGGIHITMGILPVVCKKNEEG
jgi:hypothetical protein